MRLLVAIITTMIYELALTALVLWGLPQLGVYIPVPGLVAMMVALAAAATWTYRKGSLALRKKALGGLSSMVGSSGKAVSRLAPGGTVKIGDELWEANAADGVIKPGEAIIVIEQRRLKLIVRRGGKER